MDAYGDVRGVAAGWVGGGKTEGKSIHTTSGTWFAPSFKRASGVREAIPRAPRGVPEGESVRRSDASAPMVSLTFLFF